MEKRGSEKSSATNGGRKRGQNPLNHESVWKPIRSDPWKRWAPGSEPIRELEIARLIADDSDTLMIRMPRVDIVPGIIDDPRIELDPSKDWQDNWRIRFAGRWNAQWRGNKLAELSLDLFAEELEEVLRLRLMVDEPVDLLFACNAAYVGLETTTICNEGTAARNARNQPLGHGVTCRDPLLAMQISARCYGVSPHFELFDAETHNPTEITSEKGKEAYDELASVTRSIRNEPVPGLQFTFGDDKVQQGIAAMLGEDSDSSGLLFKDPIAATLDIYTLIGTMGLGFIEDDTRLVRVPESLAQSLGANVTFADAIAAIRRVDPDGLPLWLDFTSDSGQPAERLHSSGLSQPLYGVMVAFESDPDQGGPFHAVVPVGRTSSLDPAPIATGVIAVGKDDGWRWPMEEDRIGAITAHRGGVAVRNINFEHEMYGVEPAITREWVRREIAGHFASTSEWVLARVGAILTGLDDGLLCLSRTVESERTFDLEICPIPSKSTVRSENQVGPWELATRLRKSGSVARVAEQVGLAVQDVRSQLDAAGIDPDQVRRDEVLRRYRATGSIDAVGLPILRADMERFLRNAGVDPRDTPVPHDVTDPGTLEAIAAYRRAGTLEAAGAELGVSGETVRRRMADAGLRAEEVETDDDRRLAEESAAAFYEADQSLAGASRILGVDPRTIKLRLARAGVDAKRKSSWDENASVDELVALYELVGSIRQVALLAGTSVDSVRNAIGPVTGKRRGRHISDDALDQAEIAYAEQGSVRAAARALGLSPGTFQYRLKKAQARDQR